MDFAVRNKNRFVKLISESQWKLSVCMGLLSPAVYYGYLMTNVLKKKLSPVKSVNDYTTCFPAKVKLWVSSDYIGHVLNLTRNFLSLYLNKCDVYLAICSFFFFSLIFSLFLFYLLERILLLFPMFNFNPSSNYTLSITYFIDQNK